MEPLAKLLVSILELAETELKVFKKSIIRLGLSLVMILGAGVFGIIGLCWVLEAIFLWMVQLTNRPTAFLISGVLFLAAAGVLGVIAFGDGKKKKADAAASAGETLPPASHREGKSDESASKLRIAS